MRSSFDKKMKLKASMILVLASLAIAVSLIAFWPGRNLWQQYGVTYTDEVGPTGTYYTYEFTREYQGEIVRGPRIQGSTLKLRYKDIDDDGIPEAIFQSATSNTYRTVIKIHPTPESGRHFTIVSSKGLGVNWPIDGYHKD